MSAGITTIHEVHDSKFSLSGGLEVLTSIFLLGSFKKYMDNVAPLQIICQKFKINTLYFVKTFTP
jgi:hypothetical protein